MEKYTRRASDRGEQEEEIACFRRKEDKQIIILSDEDLSELHAIAQSSRVIRRFVIPVIAAIIGLITAASTILAHISFIPKKG